MLHRCFYTGFSPDFHRICTGFSEKSEKIVKFFAIFFSLCINDLQES